MSRRITCRAVRDLLPLHCGGDLPSEQAVAVDQHLHACLACFREFREHAAMRGRLGVLAEEPLPAGVLDHFTEDVMARIAVGEAGPAAALPSARTWQRLDVPAARWAAAAALLLALGYGLAEAQFFGRNAALPRSIPVRSPLVDAGNEELRGLPGVAESSPALAPRMIAPRLTHFGDSAPKTSTVTLYIDPDSGLRLPAAVQFLPVQPEAGENGLVPDTDACPKRPRVSGDAP